MPVRPTTTRPGATTAPTTPSTTPSSTPSTTPAPTATTATTWGPGPQPFNGGDGFSPSTATGRALGAGGTPDGVKFMTTSQGVNVLSQREAGDYYCEHTSWVLNHEARQAGTSVRKNAQGQPLTGFLHLPGALDHDGPDRHAASAEVIGSAFRGFTDAVRAGNAKTDPVRLQITGYGAFPGVSDNPTGNFVSHQENIDAAMRNGFGNTLLGPGKTVQTPAGPALEYRVKDAATGKPFSVQVLAHELEVNDSAIDGGTHSVQQLLHTFKPHGALSLGVDPGASDYEAVVRSDHGGMREVGGKLQHDDASMRGTEGNQRVILNDALAKAIRAGSQAPR